MKRSAFGAFADPDGRDHGRRGLPLVDDPSHDPSSTARREFCILMDVHPGLSSRLVDRISSPISFRDSVPDGQPIERSQLVTATVGPGVAETFETILGGDHGTHRIHRHRNHGTADVRQPRQGGLSYDRLRRRGRRDQAGRRARRPCRGFDRGTDRGQRHHLHDGAQLARRRGGGPRPRRYRGERPRRGHGRRHQHHLSGGYGQGRRGPRRQRNGVRRRGSRPPAGARGGGRAHVHGRRH